MNYSSLSLLNFDNFALFLHLKQAAESGILGQEGRLYPIFAFCFTFFSFPLAFLSPSFSFHYVPAPIPLSFWGICLIENVEMPKNLEWFFSFFK